MKLPAACLVLAFAAGTASAQGVSAKAAPQRNPGKDARFFDRRVAPILQRRCLPCHNQELKDGGISFLDRDSLLQGGARSPAIVPGHPENSVLIRAILHNSDPQMPPGPKLAAKDIATLTDWVRRGAPWGTKLRNR